MLGALLRKKEATFIFQSFEKWWAVRCHSSPNKITAL
jgi:hypothetical protein